MDHHWQDYLRREGVIIENSRVTGFAACAQNESASQLTALLDVGVLRVSGEDAATFLQAHFCNDVASITSGQSQLSGYCSPKGRLLAIFQVIKFADALLLVMPAEVIESVLKRLNMFAQMARPTGKQLIGQVSRTAVELKDVSDDLLVLGIQGEQVEQEVRQVMAQGGQVTLAQVPSEVDVAPRYLCIVAAAEAEALWQAASSLSSLVTAETWQLADIRAGLPVIVQATQDAFVPQMTNLHLLGGVSFTKGCYPGQEIVARMQYLGTLKRRMQRFRVSQQANQLGINPGDMICTPDDAAAGVVVRAAAVGMAGESESVAELLVVIKISALASSLLLGDSAGPELSSLPLPYSLAID